MSGVIAHRQQRLKADNCLVIMALGAIKNNAMKFNKICHGAALFMCFLIALSKGTCYNTPTCDLASRREGRIAPHKKRPAGMPR
jgi:hypothetical protein